MIKSGAHRISPLEIEEHICEVEGVSEAAIIGVNDDILGEVIKACVVAETEGDVELLKTCGFP